MFTSAVKTLGPKKDQGSTAPQRKQRLLLLFVLAARNLRRVRPFPGQLTSTRGYSEIERSFSVDKSSSCQAGSLCDPDIRDLSKQRAPPTQRTACTGSRHLAETLELHRAGCEMTFSEPAATNTIAAPCRDCAGGEIILRDPKAFHPSRPALPIFFRWSRPVLRMPPACPF
jgi:hypothetical protein